MRIGKASLTCGAFGQPSVPLSLSRRAHLLTTPKIGGVLPTADVRFPMERVEVIAYRHIPS